MLGQPPHPLPITPWAPPRRVPALPSTRTVAKTEVSIPTGWHAFSYCLAGKLQQAHGSGPLPVLGGFGLGNAHSSKDKNTGETGPVALMGTPYAGAGVTQCPTLPPSHSQDQVQVQELEAALPGCISQTCLTPHPGSFVHAGFWQVHENLHISSGPLPGTIQCQPVH
ncbi:Hypothetical predicted protein [Marmota monax]|uniref:Uncharacterized protein n=1 Tax=Marmota monax TaxID=9995 RepID=A0A5E4AH76_MARMO|nr:Hypothetical predicted protein [Marmota monax]